MYVFKQEVFPSGDSYVKILVRKRLPVFFVVVAHLDSNNYKQHKTIFLIIIGKHKVKSLKLVVLWTSDGLKIGT